jgi:hypothetical protein
MKNTKPEFFYVLVWGDKPDRDDDVQVFLSQGEMEDHLRGLYRDGFYSESDQPPRFIEIPLWTMSSIETILEVNFSYYQGE